MVCLTVHSTLFSWMTQNILCTHIVSDCKKGHCMSKMNFPYLVHYNQTIDNHLHVLRCAERFSKSCPSISNKRVTVNGWVHYMEGGAKYTAWSQSWHCNESTNVVPYKCSPIELWLRIFGISSQATCDLQHKRDLTVGVWVFIICISVWTCGQEMCGLVWSNMHMRNAK